MNEFVVFAGPCAFENDQMAIEIALGVKKAGAHVFRAGLWKGGSSPEKVHWGVGKLGVRMMEKISYEIMPVATEVQNESEISCLNESNFAWLWIGARFMQNYPLQRVIGKWQIQTGGKVMLKRGFGNTIQETIGAVRLIKSASGGKEVWVCERGIVSFERSDEVRWRPDLLSIPQFQKEGYKVVFDGSHSVGKREYVIPMCAAAVAAGCDGIMVEVHKEPDKSVTDANQAISIEEFGELMQEINSIRRVKDELRKRTEDSHTLPIQEGSAR